MTTEPPPEPVHEGLGLKSHPAKSKPWVRAVQTVLSIGLAIFLIGYVLPRVTDTTWGEIWRIWTNIGWATFLGLIAMMLIAVATHTFAIIAAVPGLRYNHAYRVNLASTAVSNSVPLGGALALGVTYTMIRSYGFRRSSIGLAVTLLGITDALGKLALPVLGLLALALSPNAEISQTMSRAAMIGAFFGVLVLGMVIAAVSSSRATHRFASILDSVWHVAARVAKLSRRELHLTQKAQLFRLRAARILRHGWFKIILGVFGLRVVQALLFWMCLEAVGLDVSAAAALAAFALGRLLAMVPITPAGIGVTETGTAAALAAFGADPALAAAGAVLYSLVTTVMQVPFGMVSWVTWVIRHGKTPPYGKRYEAMHERDLEVDAARITELLHQIDEDAPKKEH